MRLTAPDESISTAVVPSKRRPVAVAPLRATDWRPCDATLPAAETMGPKREPTVVMVLAVSSICSTCRPSWPASGLVSLLKPLVASVAPVRKPPATHSWDAEPNTMESKPRLALVGLIQAADPWPKANSSCQPRSLTSVTLMKPTWYRAFSDVVAAKPATVNWSWCRLVMRAMWRERTDATGRKLLPTHVPQPW